MNKKVKKYSGRLGISIRQNEFDKDTKNIRMSLRVSSDDNYPIAMTFQSFLDTATNCGYSIRLTDEISLTGYDFEDTLKFLTKIKTLIEKESAPRARLYADGKPYIDQCDFSRFVQACNKLGFETKHCDSWANACRFSNNEELKELEYQIA